ncbi:MFS general substrate transporter [Apiospora aurea]|uniref:MFS general substrate transporter n=1 Tax=Apiospora aurea TaxID=335848 RepID=A0ABR1QHA6_9PEZI
MAQPRLTEPSPGQSDNSEVTDFANPDANTKARSSGSIEKKRSRKDDVDDGDGSTTYASVSSSSLSVNPIPSSASRVPTRGSEPPLSRVVSEVYDGIESRHDVEISGDGDGGGGAPLEEEKTRASTALNPNDPHLVTWTGRDDPANPKNWAYPKKWRAVFIVSCFTLMSPLSSSLVAPSLGVIGQELDVPPGTQQALILSIFILAYAIGPLVWGPLSELFGRIVVLQTTNLLYLCFNLGCGLARTKAQLIIFRLLAGLGGSAPLAIGGGVLADLFTAEQRGKAMSIYSLMPLLGPAIGPIGTTTPAPSLITNLSLDVVTWLIPISCRDISIAGAFITENTTWRWSFWATTIADAVIQLLGLFFLRETYAPVLLKWKRQRLVKETGNTELHTPYDDPDRTVARTLRTAVARPFRLLATQVIIQVLALYMMYLYGLMYIVLVSFPSLFSGPVSEGGYGESLGIGGLNYISLGLGFFLGAQVCAPLQDRIYAALKRRSARNGGSGVGRPEYRVPMMVPGAILIPVGLFIYGWTAEYKTHWIGPNIGACLFCIGTIIGFQCVQGFLVDTYTRYAASAVGAATVMRSLAGFGFPLFASDLYDRLGLGWGNSLLAFLGIVIGWPSPVLLWYYGETLRKREPVRGRGALSERIHVDDKAREKRSRLCMCLA